MIVDYGIVNPPSDGRFLLRLLTDPPLTGVVNMARDEAILTLVGQLVSPPTLRLYEWSTPTVSLGYFQPFRHYQAVPAPAGGLTTVRRTTGGGAILHDRELTYSLTLPLQHPLISGAPNRLYEIVHHALIQCLLETGVDAHCHGQDDASSPARGPFFCFERRHRYDIMIADRKLVGSAQRRTRAALLQHGSIIIERRFEQQTSAELASAGVDAPMLRARWPTQLAREFHADLENGSWNPRELLLAQSIEHKYAADSWTKRR